MTTFRYSLALSIVALALAVTMLAALNFGSPSTTSGGGGYTITKTDDTADGDCGVDCSLREAIIESNAVSGADIITLPAGTYTLSIDDILKEDVSATGDLDINSEITINGAGADTTIIDGGGLSRVFNVRAPAAATISGVTIRNGHAGFGAGIYIQGGSLALTDSAVSGNTTTVSGAGGGIFNQAILTIDNSTISGNTATGAYGGGLYNFSVGTATITNSTISGNMAGFGAGGIFNGTPGTTTLTNVTISDNSVTSANSGGGIRKDGTGGSVTLKNTIVANSGSGGNCFGTITSGGNNLEDGTTCGLGSGDLSSTNPMLSPLALNAPGTTETHALMPGSQAIDSGANSGCPAADQRGVARPIDGDGDKTPDCDIGAYEAPFVVGTPTPVPTATPSGKIAQGDLQCDLDVDSVDALQGLRDVAGLSTFQEDGCPTIGNAGAIFGDVDCDEDVDSVDALKILRHVAALAVTQTEPCTDIGDPL